MLVKLSAVCLVTELNLYLLTYFANSSQSRYKLRYMCLSESSCLEFTVVNVYSRSGSTVFQVDELDTICKHLSNDILQATLFAYLANDGN